jgi:hypothetical protein
MEINVHVLLTRIYLHNIIFKCTMIDMFPHFKFNFIHSHFYSYMHPVLLKRKREVDRMDFVWRSSRKVNIFIGFLYNFSI